MKKYLLLLYGAAANLLNTFGYSTKAVYDAVRGYKHRTHTIKCALGPMIVELRPV
jgi:hypothetical protein